MQSEERVFLTPPTPDCQVRRKIVAGNLPYSFGGWWPSATALRGECIAPTRGWYHLPNGFCRFFVGLGSF